MRSTTQRQEGDHDPEAEVHVLLGRDAPEILKVREFKHGPKGAPWAQKLLLGWTISGQLCLDALSTNGVQIHVHLTRLSSPENATHSVQSDTYSHIPGDDTFESCRNKFVVKEVYAESDTKPDVISDYRRGQRRRTLPRGCNPEPSMPNNRVQALNRFNGLTRTLKRKTEMYSELRKLHGDNFQRPRIHCSTRRAET
ncbi:predicted protein [Nematostella vectensis]|uniref:Uncharacterized protein n=1 Tax=Nematostella vectensis TaxID=45351 RepID=A7SEH8_NEMVE|nr:predicted protein [Nematostella vectensis]|eukprot:XP_001629926.1 predicted protein [Nematostella vectensis]